MNASLQSATPIPPAETMKEREGAAPLQPSRLENLAGVPVDLLATLVADSPTPAVDKIPSGPYCTAVETTSVPCAVEESTAVSPFRGYEQNHTWPEESVADTQYQHQYHEPELEEAGQEEGPAALEGQDAYGYDTEYHVQPTAFREVCADGYNEEQQSCSGDACGNIHDNFCGAAPLEISAISAGTIFQGESGRKEAYCAESQQGDFCALGENDAVPSHSYATAHEPVVPDYNGQTGEEAPLGTSAPSIQ
jgi:hypothetical protein